MADVEPSGDSDRDSGSEFDSDSDSPPITDITVSTMLNPYSQAPLTAVLKISHDALVPENVTEIAITVNGKGDADDLSVVVRPQTEAFKTNFDMNDLLSAAEVGIPILGLFSGYANEVSFEIRTDAQRFTGSTVIQTEPIGDLADEQVTVDVLNAEALTPGWTYINNRVYDHVGNCRWYGPDIVRILRNGNILTRLDEVSWIGRTLIGRSLPDHLRPHHDTTELSNGNIVACVDNVETEIINVADSQVVSIEDYVVELDKLSGDIVNAWDLREYLDVSRTTVSALKTDWLHMNTVCYDEADDTIIVSGRYQGIIKLTRGGIQGKEANAGKTLKWILSPHLDWDLAGWDGAGPIDPNDYLLTAVDEDDAPFHQTVQDNCEVPTPDSDAFFWSVGQHGLEISARQDGLLRLLTFNNLASFVFDGPGTTENGLAWRVLGQTDNDRAAEPFSQIIEYEIDERQMTVKKVWSFGEHQPDLYGSYNSGVTFLAATGNRIMVTNGVDQEDLENNPHNPQVLEISEAGEVLYRLEITQPSFSAQRAGRIILYHPNESTNAFL